MSPTCLCFHTTCFQYGGDEHGMAHVVRQLVWMLLAVERLSDLQFIATAGDSLYKLANLSIPESRIVHVPWVRLVRCIPRLHGLLINWRHLGIRERAFAIVCPDFRSVVCTPVVQVVIYHEFIFTWNVETFAVRRSGPCALARQLDTCFLRHMLRRASWARHSIAISRATQGDAYCYVPDLVRDSGTVLYVGSRLTRLGITHPSPPGEVVEFLFVEGANERHGNPAGLFWYCHTVSADSVLRLHVVGAVGEPERRPCENRTQMLGMDEDTTPHWLVKDSALAKLCTRCHILLFPNLMGRSGLPLAEAMRFGLVVCAFRNTSIPEVVGEAAVLARDNDFAAWGQAIEAMMQEPSKYSAMSAAALARSSLFTEEAMLRRYGDYLTRVCGVETDQISKCTSQLKAAIL